jgi:hypothetical protein
MFSLCSRQLKSQCAKEKGRCCALPLLLNNDSSVAVARPSILAAAACASVSAAAAAVPNGVHDGASISAAVVAAGSYGIRPSG